MQDAELERLLSAFFFSGRERDAEAENKILSRLECLPRQVRSFSAFDEVLFDWKLKLSWTRVALLLGCAIFGLLLGIELFGIQDGRGAALADLMP